MDATSKHGAIKEADASHSEVLAVDVFDLRCNIADEQSLGRRSDLPRRANGFNIVRASVQQLQ
jgi:hypothetical protein